MPELPELKIMRRRIINMTVNKKIVDFNIFKLKLKQGALDNFKTKIIGSYIMDIYPIGKMFIFKLASCYYVLVNMQSTGFFIYVSGNDLEKFKDEKYIRAEFVFSDSSKILFIDPRGHSYLRLLSDKQLKQARLDFGMDPLSKKFNYKVFLSLIRNRTTTIKNFLTNDKVFVGIGKVYSDEICFEARIKPDKAINQLSQGEINRLFKAITKILRKSQEYDGLSMYLPVSNKNLRFDRFLYVYGWEGEKCRKCKIGTIKKDNAGQSISFYCPVCQR